MGTLVHVAEMTEHEYCLEHDQPLDWCKHPRARLSMGCWLCHGTRVRVRYGRQHDQATWVTYIPCECAPESARKSGKPPNPRQSRRKAAEGAENR